MPPEGPSTGWAIGPPLLIGASPPCRRPTGLVRQAYGVGVDLDANPDGLTGSVTTVITADGPINDRPTRHPARAARVARLGNRPRTAHGGQARASAI